MYSLKKKKKRSRIYLHTRQIIPLLAEKSNKKRYVRFVGYEGSSFFLFFFIERIREEFHRTGCLEFPFHGIDARTQGLALASGSVPRPGECETEKERGHGASPRLSSFSLGPFLFLARLYRSDWLPDVVSSTQTQNRAKR